VKGTYNIYQSVIDFLTRHARKQKLGKSASMEECILYILNHEKIQTQAFEQAIMSAEYYWRKHSRVVIFPESVKTLERIQQVKLSIKDMGLISFPHESFYLAFPKDYKIAGLPAAGCLVSYMGADQIRKLSQNFYDVFLPNAEINIQFSPSFMGNKKGITIIYVTPTESVMAHSRLSYDSYSLTELLSLNSWQEYKEFTTGYNSRLVGNLIPSNPLDAQYEFELIQLVARIGIFSSASPDGLIEGFPTIRPKHLEPKGLKYKDITLHVKGSQSAHYRSWYIRQLMDKRYYKNEHASEPIGSRLVFVSSSHDDLKIEPETLL